MREDRELSLAVAERTGVRHESPQVICLFGGRPVGHASHYDINAAELARLVAAARRRGGGA